ncbi:MAG: hypothetical protein HC916_14480 [Coleofasciculaceae cyanobacterium SM2_1_6]|nr:hypothetical protein [Coleofasciculaceae cyanobacterium SM2_1_6]
MKSLNEARESLGIQKSTLYTWMKVTKVKTVKEQGKGFFDEESIATLEALKTHLESGGNFESWGQSEMITASPESIDLPESEPEVLEDPQHNPMSELVGNAQRQAAGVLIAQNMLARKYLDDPESLPPEFQALINKSKPVPKSIDPLQYAQTLTGMNLDFLMSSLSDPPQSEVMEEILEVLEELAA